jgi:hypothetical protein
MLAQHWKLADNQHCSCAEAAVLLAVSEHGKYSHSTTAACAGTSLQGDHYTDAWILEKRLSRIPGKPVSEKPFYRTVGSNCSIT